SSWSFADDGHLGDDVAIWGTSPNDLWIADERGYYLRWEGASWSSTVWEQAPVGIADMWGSGPNDIWVLAATSSLHWDGATCAQVPIAATNKLNALAGTGPNDIWAVGWSGAAAHWDGTAWAPVTLATTQNLYSVWFDGGTGWAVGDQGVILRYQSG